MFFPIRFKTSVQLAPTDLHDDFDVVILGKLQRNLEGVCSRYGYIKPGSLEIIKRSAGKLMKQHFNGYVYFTVVCKGDVCNPAKDTVVEATVVNKNALGILAESHIDDSKTAVLDIIVPKKTAGIVSEIDVDSISIGDKIFVMVIGKRFQLNDTKISIIGKVVRDPKDAPVGPESVVEEGEGEAGSDSDLAELSDVEDEVEDGEEDPDDGEGNDYDNVDMRDYDDDDDAGLLGGSDDDASDGAAPSEAEFSD